MDQLTQLLLEVSHALARKHDLSPYKDHKLLCHNGWFLLFLKLKTFWVAPPAYGFLPYMLCCGLPLSLTSCDSPFVLVSAWWPIVTVPNLMQHEWQICLSGAVICVFTQTVSHSQCAHILHTATGTFLISYRVCSGKFCNFALNRHFAVCFSICVWYFVFVFWYFLVLIGEGGGENDFLFSTLK